MKRRPIPWLPILILGSVPLLAASPYARKPKLDWVIVNARVYAPGGATAIGVSGSKIAWVGTDSEARAECADACRVIDAQGRFLMPGFNNAHTHLISGGASADRAQVSGSSIPSIQAEVRAFASSHPDDAWILGRGWYAAGFGSSLPTRQDLDAAEAARPVLLVDSDGHEVWANTAAIRAAGIDKNTRDPDGGTIVRDSEGEPSGMFLENAADLIWDKVPEPSEATLQTYIRRGEDTSLAAGFTSAQGGPISLTRIRAYADLDREGKLRQRAFLWADLRASDDEFRKIVDFARSLPADGKARVTAFKGFVDGVISSYTAAMLAPYSDRRGESGTPLMTQEELDRWVLRANRAGFPVALHAIGDRAVRMSLDAFAKSKETLHHSLMNRIEHIEVIDPADVPRFGELGVAASVQPSHMHFGSASSFYYYERVGAERVKHAFAWKDLQDGGALLLFGTDYPVVDEDPIEGMTCAIRRVFYDGTPFEPRQKLDPETAIQAYTINPMTAIGLGDRIGRIAAGYEADVILLDADPRDAGAASLSGNPPSLVAVGGKILLDLSSR